MSENENIELTQLVSELRKTVESKNAESGEAKAKIEKLEKDLFSFEEKNQKLVLEMAEAKKADEELEKGFKNLERQVYMMPNSMNKSEKTEAMKAFEKMARHGKASLTAEEIKYLRTDSNTDGGYLAPPEYVNEIVKKITEISPVRSIARIRTTSSPKMEIPKRESLMEAYWVGEGGSITSSCSSYGLNTIKVNKLSALCPVTLEELQDAAFNIETEITSDVAERFAQKEGAAFVSGNGINKPEGFMFASGIQESNSGAAADITTDGFIDMLGKLKTGYNPTWGLNRRTFARMLKLDDGASQYAFFSPGNLSAGIPNTILGLPYVLMEDLDDIAANTYPVILGDFSRGYTIVDHTQMMVIRDDYTLAGDGKVRFVFHMRVGGGVELEEAFVKMKVAS